MPRSSIPRTVTVTAADHYDDDYGRAIAPDAPIDQRRNGGDVFLAAASDFFAQLTEPFGWGGGHEEATVVRSFYDDEGRDADSIDTARAVFTDERLRYLGDRTIAPRWDGRAPAPRSAVVVDSSKRDRRKRPSRRSKPSSTRDGSVVEEEMKVDEDLSRNEEAERSYWARKKTGVATQLDDVKESMEEVFLDPDFFYDARDEFGLWMDVLMGRRRSGGSRMEQ